MKKYKKWKKLGRIFSPSMFNQHPKLLSHAANPLPIHLSDDIYRIFFNGRDMQNRSSVGAVDIDIVKRCVVQEFHEPFIEHGSTNSFFCDGISIGNSYIVNGVRYILFMGWQVSGRDHWRGDIGRFELNRDYTLKVCDEKPLLSSDDVDPVSLSYPWVMPNETGGFHMWYGSTYTWDTGNGEMLHVINYASSRDGENWIRKGLSIPFELGKAQAFSRPTVVKNRDNAFQMWFSYRGGGGDKYRIGYAESNDGRQWKLAIEKSGIDVASTGWDSEMIEYPFVFGHKGQQYMLYNGNGYGKSGFGLAVLDIASSC